jgi:hypothetical protein
MNIIDHLERSGINGYDGVRSWSSPEVDYLLALLISSGELLRPSQAAEQAKLAGWELPAVNSLVESIQRAYAITVQPEDLMEFVKNLDLIRG